MVLNMRPIDANNVVKSILEERDKLALYKGFEQSQPYRHNQALRGGLRKALRCIEESPTIDVVSKDVYDQIRWERDVAIAQLEELGIGFGQVKPDMEIVRHGYWKVIEESETGRLLECSECKEWIFHNLNYISNYCSHCGAKMDLEEK